MIQPEQLERPAFSGECRIWTGGNFDYFGYGRLRINRRWHMAHRWIYELLVGPIPDGMQIDHLCENKSCVNPNHLQTVTRRTNILRGDAPPAANHRKLYCKRGHALDEANTRLTVTKNGQIARTCKTCVKMVKRQYSLTHPRKSRARG